MARRIKIFDTTLRDGEQSPGCSMNMSEKLRMAEQLDALGVDVIEAGFAIASPGDFQAVKSIAAVVKRATVASLARALDKDISVAYDAVKDAVHPRIHVFLATSELHMKYKLKMTREEVLKRAYESVAYAKSLCDDVEFSAEDASRSDPDFLCAVLSEAIRAGAKTVNVPDTVGYAVPDEYGELISYVIKNVKGIENADVSVHCHNDLGMATANSLAAVKAGATQVECTVNGIGERAGNTALEEVVMALYTRREFYDTDCGVDTTQIFKSSKLLSMITGVKVQPNKAVVGENAFAHESGIHQHGVLANKKTYEIMTPESIGLTENKMVLGKHSGKHALADRLKSLGMPVSDETLADIFDEFKKLADRQKSVSDRDLEALAHKKSVCVPESYKLDRFVINVGNTITTTSAVKLDCPDGQKREVVSSSAFGPIDASYKAINEIVGGESFELVDFLIDAVTGGTDAQGAVTVKIQSGGSVYNGHAVSLDIVNAAVMAYVSAINNMIYDKSLLKDGQ
ncbi:MAG: 2-isopropylmalate synthase [Christensenellales bacterium]|jgi:2-isopropylmalate synthase